MVCTYVRNPVDADDDGDALPHVSGQKMRLSAKRSSFTADRHLSVYVRRSENQIRIRVRVFKQSRPNFPVSVRGHCIIYVTSGVEMARHVSSVIFGTGLECFKTVMGNREGCRGSRRSCGGRIHGFRTEYTIDWESAYDVTGPVTHGNIFYGSHFTEKGRLFSLAEVSC